MVVIFQKFILVKFKNDAVRYIWGTCDFLFLSYPGNYITYTKNLMFFSKVLISEIKQVFGFNIENFTHFKYQIK